MPREDAHRTKARNNESFAASLDRSDPTAASWAVVAAFYSALHYVEAYFARFGVVCHSHEPRDREFKRDPRIVRAYASYKFLFALSHTARYRLVSLPARPYEQAAFHLERVRRQIDQALDATSPN